jgi:hypothetical protein
LPSNGYTSYNIITEDTEKWEDSEEDGKTTVLELEEEEEEEGSQVAVYCVCCPSWLFSVSKSKILGQRI